MLNLFSSVITIILFGVTGYLYSGKAAKSINYPVIIIWVIISLLSFCVGIDTKIISVLGFNILLNQILGGFTSGYTIFIIVEKIINRKLNTT